MKRLAAGSIAQRLVFRTTIAVGGGKLAPRTLFRQRPPWSCSQYRWYSQQSNEEGSGKDNSKGPKDIFPWRHSVHLVPRVEFERSRMKAGFRSRVAVWVMEAGSACMMDCGFFEAFGQQWKHDLAENSAWAFTYGMGAILSNVFKVPFDDIYVKNGDEAEINFVYTTPFSKAGEHAKRDTEGATQESEKSGISYAGSTEELLEETSDSGSTEESPEETSDTGKEKRPSIMEKVDSLFESTYVDLFRSFYRKTHVDLGLSDTPRPLEITLRMKPVDCEVHKVFAFPFLSRKAVQEYPEFQEEYCHFLAVGQKKGVRPFLNLMFDFMHRNIEAGKPVATTMIADIVVDCVETFQIRELTTSSIIQGEGDERVVRHVLRMELDLDIVDDDILKANWRIADVDDNFAGKQWTPTKF